MIEPAKKPRGAGFKKGDDPRRHDLHADRPKPEPRPFQPVEGEGLLAAMRHVLVNDKTHDATEEQKEVRAWLRGSRPTFFAKKADLEKAELLARAAKSAGGGGSGPGPEAAPTVPPPPPDLGTDACLELIDDLLGGAA